ncbi:MAG: putative ABC transporter permease [Ruminococcus sp.]|nr:putative ABC transporter permease [Ruminococcus sp.]
MCIKWDTVVFLLGGVSYSLIEILWRGYTHYTMVLLGGVCFLSLYKLFNLMKDYSLLEKCVAGAILITTLEFTVGCFVNLVFHMNVWNYSSMPFNLLGQVCLVYSTLWGFLCIPINFLTKKIHSVAKLSHSEGTK